MAWAKIDDGWWCHPKTMNLTVSAAGLWALALSWSCQQRRDVVPPRFLAMVDAHEDHAKELVDAGFWHETPDGWRIHDWATYQERPEREASETGTYGNHVRWHVNRGVTDVECEHCTPTDRPDIAPESPPISDEASPPIAPGPTRPVPTHKTPSSPDGDREAAESDAEDAAHADALETFEEFWKVYPERGGKKPGKGNALIEWRKLTLEQRRRAYRGAKNLASSDQLPKDAERFLRRAKGGKGDFPFDDWQEPAREHGTPPPKPDTCHLCGFALDGHDDETCAAVQEARTA